MSQTHNWFHTLIWRKNSQIVNKPSGLWITGQLRAVEQQKRVVDANCWRGVSGARALYTELTTRAFAHVVRGAKFASKPRKKGLTVNALCFNPHTLEIDFCCLPFYTNPLTLKQPLCRALKMLIQPKPSAFVLCNWIWQKNSILFLTPALLFE